MSTLVRAATADDLAELEPLLWPPLMQPPKRPRFLRGLAEGDVVVAIEDGAIAAYMWVYEYFFGHTFIAYLGVADARRRRGHAGRLLASAERRAVSDRVFSSTNASNAPMQAVFERYGWTRCGVIDDLDPGDPEWVYVKYVSPAGANSGRGPTPESG